jgi:hypothetical protein
MVESFAVVSTVVRGEGKVLFFLLPLRRFGYCREDGKAFYK